MAVSVRYRDVPLMRRAVVDDVDNEGGFLHTDVPMPVGSVIELAPADSEQPEDTLERVTARVERVVEQPRRQQQQAETTRPGMRLRFTSEAGVEALLATAGELAIEMAEPEAIGGKHRAFNANAPAFRTASRAEAAALRHIATAEAQAELLRQTATDTTASESGETDAASADASNAETVVHAAAQREDTERIDGSYGGGDTEVAQQPGGLDESATVIDSAPAGEYVFEADTPDGGDAPPPDMMRFGRAPTGDTQSLQATSGEISAAPPQREDTERIEAEELAREAEAEGDSDSDIDGGGEGGGDDDEGVVQELRARRKTAFYGAVDVEKKDDEDSGDDDDSSSDDGDADSDSDSDGDGDGDGEAETTSSKRRRKRRGGRKRRK
ncbi:MAG: hypothetical protein KC503_32590 [Myxococcales bacterium]|nr:hypothetical protein [Myxococcales bacterium]